MLSRGKPFPDCSHDPVRCSGTSWLQSRPWHHREFSSNMLSRISRKLARMRQMRIYIVNETAIRSRALDERSRAKLGRQGLCSFGLSFFESIECHNTRVGAMWLRMMPDRWGNVGLVRFSRVVWVAVSEQVPELVFLFVCSQKSLGTNNYWAISWACDCFFSFVA